MSSIEENGHWADISFRRVLELDSDELAVRQSLLDSGLPLRRADALYPLPSFTVLPSLKAPGQPRFSGFHSEASDELY